jgi:hypothetical protein
MMPGVPADNPTPPSARTHLVERPATIRRLTDHQHAGLGAEVGRQAGTEHGVAVDQEHPDIRLTHGT